MTPLAVTIIRFALIAVWFGAMADAFWGPKESERRALGWAIAISVVMIATYIVWPYWHLDVVWLVTLLLLAYSRRMRQRYQVHK